MERNSRAERYEPGAPTVRYPDPDVIILDPRFGKYRLGSAAIERLATGTRWAEGPAWNGVGNFLVWSDIPNNRQLRWLQEDSHVSTFRASSNYANGNTFDYQGRQLACEHGTRRVVRYEHDGSVTVLADNWNGKRLNAPNDIVVHPDGGIWFTDPGYGAMMNYEGYKGELEIREAVYRIDGATGKMTLVNDDLAKPNGLCFSPDYRKLYIVDTGGNGGIWVWDMADDGTKLKAETGRVFVTMKMDIGGKTVTGGSDGIRADVDGNIWSAAGWAGDGYDGVHVFAPDGDHIGQILLPEICSNVCFGGPRRNRLFMTASQSLYALYVETQGAHIC